jgi:hypothetical protein
MGRRAARLCQEIGSFGFSPLFELLWRHNDEDHGVDQDEDGGGYHGRSPNGDIKKIMGNVPHRDRDQRRTNGNQMVYDFGHCCAPPKVNAVVSGLAIQFLVFSCQ